MFMKSWGQFVQSWFWEDYWWNLLQNLIFNSIVDPSKNGTIPASFCLDEDVLKTSWRCIFSLSLEDLSKTSSRRLHQYEYIRRSHTSSEDVLKTYSWRLNQGQYIRLGYTSSRRLQDVWKAFSRCLQKHLQDVLPRRVQDVLQKVLQGVFTTFCNYVFKTFLRHIIRLTVCLGHTSEKFIVSVRKIQVW